MKPNAIIVFLVLAMLTSQAFSWSWSRRRRKRSSSSGSRFLEISTLTGMIMMMMMMMMMIMTMMKKITTTCHNYKQCFGMLMSHLCPREFPQNVKFESLNFNQINFDMKISEILFQKDFPLLNLYSIIHIYMINPHYPVNSSGH